MEDAYSKWIEVFLVNSTGAQIAVDKFRELFSRFGLPEYLVTDNGPPFTSSFFQEFLVLNGINHRTSSPYYPQSNNNQAESGVKIIKTFLQKIKMVNVESRLPQFLFDYRVSVHTTTKECPAKLLIGRIARTRFDLLKPNMRKMVEVNQEKQVQSKCGIVREFKPNEIVLVSDYGNNKWTRGRIKQREGSVIYVIELENKVIYRMHTNQILKLNQDIKKETVPQLESTGNITDKRTNRVKKIKK